MSNVLSLKRKQTNELPFRITECVNCKVLPNVEGIYNNGGRVTIHTKCPQCKDEVRRSAATRCEMCGKLLLLDIDDYGQLAISCRVSPNGCGLTTRPLVLKECLTKDLLRESPSGALPFVASAAVA